MKLIDLVESKDTKVPTTIKPRAKALNDALMSRKGGSHYTSKFDYKRAKEKSNVRKQISKDLEK